MIPDNEIWEALYKELAERGLPLVANHIRDLKAENEDLKNLNRTLTEIVSIQNQKDNPLHIRIAELSTRIRELEEKYENTR